MLQRQRGIGGRSRVTPRQSRRPPGVGGDALLVEARRAALGFVAERWPELVGVTPVVTSPYPGVPGPVTLARLGLDDADLEGRRAAGVTFTFTFVGERVTTDGAVMPVVANVTVDTLCRITKASVSR